jgi:uncharacterized sporulation protein YeaH/YhbH (DUF444 family)
MVYAGQAGRLTEGKRERMNIIDRRLNPKGKSLANRQRFLRRAREQIVKAVRDSSGKRNIQDIENGDKI